MSERFTLTRETFETEQTTINFVLLTLGTCGFYYYYWMLNFIKSFNKKIGTLIIELPIVLVMIGLTEWAGALPEDMSKGLDLVIGIMFLVSIILAIYIAVNLRKHVELFFKAAGYNIPVNTVWTVVFQFYYFYYLLHNFEEISQKNSALLQNYTEKTPADKDIGNTAS